MYLLLRLKVITTFTEVAGSIPVAVIGIFLWIYTSGTEVDSASKRNEYQWYLLGFKGDRSVVLATLLRSCVKCPPEHPGNLELV